MLFERPDYRIDSRTIKRGSQVSNLIASLLRAQTFAYLTYHLSWLLFGLYPCENLELMFISIPSSSSSKTDFINILLHFFMLEVLPVCLFWERSNSLLVVSSSYDGLWCVYAWYCRACDYLWNKSKIIENGVRMKNLLGSWYWRIYRLFFNRMVLPFPIWFYPSLLDYDVSLYILVELVVTISTSPRSSKTESGCERYVRFRFVFSAVFTGPEVPALRPEFPAKFPAQSSGPCPESFPGRLGRSGGSGNSGVSAGTSSPRRRNCPQRLKKLETYLRAHLP